MDLDDWIAFAGLLVPNSGTVDPRVRHCAFFGIVTEAVELELQCKDVRSQALVRADLSSQAFLVAGPIVSSYSLNHLKRADRHVRSGPNFGNDRTGGRERAGLRPAAKQWTKADPPTRDAGRHRRRDVGLRDSLTFGRPNESDRQGQVSRVQKPLPASHQACLILVPAAVAAAENVTRRACASSPLMFLLTALSANT